MATAPLSYCEINPRSNEPILAETGSLPFRLDFVLYAVGAVVLLVVGILVLNFGMIYIRALFSGRQSHHHRIDRAALAADSGRA